jgi:cytoskeletal protein CcmA (bactofilin family)
VTEVPAGDTHDGTLVASSRTVNVDGVVEGDLFVLAEQLAVRGEVRGNVFAIAQNLEMSGRVTGSLHVASEQAHVAGEVRGDLYALSENLTLAKPAVLGRDASLAATTAVVEGTISRNVWAWIDWIEVRGSIGGDLDARGDRVALLDGAHIGGDVDAELPKGQEVETSSGAVVTGELRSAVHRHRGRTRLAQFLKLRFWAFLGVQLSGAFVVGLALHALFPALFRGRLDSSGAFFRSLGIGFLALIVVLAGLGLLVDRAQFVWRAARGSRG